MDQPDAVVSQESDRAAPTESALGTKSANRASQKSSRKRTKTGCLTCRKRRIKCGEERPICNNCIKSKRNCEGYNQRVVFKQAPAGLPPHSQELGPGHTHTWEIAMNSTYHQPYAALSLANPNPGLHPLAPRPLYVQSQDLVNTGPYGQLLTAGSLPEAYNGSWSMTPHNIPPTSTSHPWNPQTSLQHPLGPDVRRASMSILPPQTHISPTFSVHQNHGHDHGTGPMTFAGAQHPPYAPHDLVASAHSHRMVMEYGNTSWTAPAPQGFGQYIPSQSIATPLSARQQGASDHDWQTVTPHVASAANAQSLRPDRDIPAETHAKIDALNTEAILPGSNKRRYSALGFVQRPSFEGSVPSTIEPPPPPMHTFNEDDDDDDENDPWDVEMEIQDSTTQPSEQAHHDLSMMLSRHASQEETRIRTFTTFLNESNVLATYRPSHSASPLTDEKTARIFCHFITVTGPSLSIYERQSSNSTVMFNNLPIPIAQKALWTYTLPTMALGHPPLMHAMLAVGALHIAKLQQTSEGPSIKHFTYALRRVSKLIGLPRRRNEIATLAANLLIGFYEIILADHSKWNIHLAGARILVQEIDFAGMTRKLRRMRSQAKARIARAPMMGGEDYIRIAGIPETLLPDKDWEIDEELISNFTGFHIRYDHQWQPNAPQQIYADSDFTTKDVEDYKVRSDLYWWYCKQDIFQGMVSGNRLLMPYEHWAFCPPRGRIGRLDATYATMDHLCLLMARLTDFGGKDQLRKRRVIASTGGKWKPPPGFFRPSHSSQTHQPVQAVHELMSSSGVSKRSSDLPPTQVPHARHAPVSTPSQRFASASSPMKKPGDTTGDSPSPPMYGMMPTATGPIHMSSAFHMMAKNLHDSGIPSTPPTWNATPVGDLEAETSAALEEHAAIVEAFDLFSTVLGPEYQPLPPDTTPPISTPFGPALQYRTHPIACIWAFYYAGHILLHRLNPHMPPAAMMSVGLCARQTAEYAQTIGKICAGLYYPQQYSLQTGCLNPSLGAALAESTFTLFFAAIQFTDAGQRGWAINKLRDIARLTGRQSSAAMAAGCETAWERMGMAGRGPKYTPAMDRDNKDERVSGKTRRERLSNPHDPGHQSGKAANEDDEPQMINHDRRFINVNPNARVHWALGLLAVEADMRKLDLNKS